MDNLKSKRLKCIINKIYKIYHFVAKVFLYSMFIILILVAVAFMAYFADSMYNIKNNTPKSPLIGAYIIISPSMEPAIKVEDAIVVVRYDSEKLKEGDVITFLSSDPRYSGLTITHRIIGIEKSNTGEIFFRTKGDNNNSEDSALVPSDNVYGKVVLKIPMIGYIQYILTQSYGWVLLVVVPCLGIVIYDIIKLIKSVHNNISKNSKKKKQLKSEYVDVIGEEKETQKKNGGKKENIGDSKESNDTEVI